MFYSGGVGGTANKNSAVNFADRKAAESYARDCGGSVVEKEEIE